jgi:hypothetical protein
VDASRSTGVAIFNTHCRWVDPQELPEPRGGTNLAGAFEEIGWVAPTTATLVSDGQPDNAEAAHAAGLRLQCPINICFVGDGDDLQAMEFCRRLCEATGGAFATEALTLTALDKTVQTVRKMLGAGTPASIPLGGGV